jgi:regulator of protease activity HflC (stomatin/prohibitin superfamily)
MAKKNIPVALFSILMIFALTGCAAVVKPGYKGMMWKPWGKGLKTDKIYDDGLVWKWPWTSVIKYNVQWTKNQIKVPLLTADELHVTITVSVIMRPDPRKLPPLELEIGRNYYENVVEPTFFTITRSVFSNYTHKEMTVMGGQIEDDILEKLRSDLDGKHIQFNGVTLDHIMYSPLVTTAVDRKLATQQKIEQKDYEIAIAEKNAEIQRILARGQRDAQEIINQKLTQAYLQFRALEVQEKLATSSNAKFYFVPMGKNGIPLIIDAGGQMR